MKLIKSILTVMTLALALVLVLAKTPMHQVLRLGPLMKLRKVASFVSQSLETKNLSVMLIMMVLTKDTISNLEINLPKILESRLNMSLLTQPTVQST